MAQMIEALLALVLQSGSVIERFLIEDIGLSRAQIQIVLQYTAKQQALNKMRQEVDRRHNQSVERSAAIRQRVDAILRGRAKKAAEAQEPDLPK